MDNKQEQNTEFDKLLGSAQDDAKIDFGDSEADNLDDFMQEEDEPKEFSPFASVADDSFIPDEVRVGLFSGRVMLMIKTVRNKMLCLRF